MSALIGFVDDGRVVLAMTGADARAVLQGVVTNDVEDVTPGQVIYAALLTPQGKYLFDFFLLDGGPNTVLIDVAADRAAALAARLKMYCLRRDARIEPRDDLAVALIWPATPGGGEAHPPTLAPAHGAAATCVPDPRDPALGWRVYGADLGAVLDAMDVSTGDAQAYTARRIALGVPESGIELVPDDTYILEAGFERLHGVDFRKGCYVGQEVTARMKHKAELRKGLVKVRVAGDAAPGTPITADGKPAGTLYSVSEGIGLAHLRFDRAGPGMTAGAASIDYPA